MPDDPQPGDLPHNIRRVGARDRKPKLNRSADPFAALPPLPPDLPEADPPPAAPDADPVPVVDDPPPTVDEDAPAPLVDADPPPAVVEDDPAPSIVNADPPPVTVEDDPAPIVVIEAEPDPPPAPAIDPVADDLASFIDELDSGLVAAVPVDDAPPAPADDPDAAFKPPVDRFPPLPHETAELEAVRPALKTAPASASSGKAKRAAERPANREDRARAYADDRASREAAAPPGRQRALPNLLALLFFLGAILALGFIVTVWNNPFTALNPLPPLTPMPIIITATYTPTLTLTPSPTPTPTATPTPAPTETPSPVPTATAEGGIVDTGSYRFAVDNNRTLYLTNPDTRGGCAWSSIAGSVTDRAGQPVNGFSVRLIGDGVDVTVITGSVPGFGPGGFEHQTGREATVRDFTAQLIDPAGTAVSAAYPFRTSDRCDWNIAAIRFVEVGE